MKHLISTLFLITAVTFAATSTAKDIKVKHLSKGQQPAKASLADITWMQGHWKGKNPNTGRLVEHIMPKPQFNQLLGLVRFYSDHIEMNEITIFIEQNGGIDYVVRHFHSGLIAVEPVDEPIVRPLIAIEGNRYYFEGITFVNDSPEQHTVYFEQPEGERKGEILTLIQKRQ